MKKVSLLFSLLVAFATQMFAAVVETPSFSVDGIHYYITDADAKTVSVFYKMYDLENHTPVTDYTGAVTIPATVTSEGANYTVTGIYTDAFLGCEGLTSVSLPEGMLVIGEEAFKGCTGLTAITIPSTVTSLEKSAFAQCSGITAITIPDAVTTFGTNIFQDCTGLKTVVLPAGVQSIANSMFSGCTGLTEFEVPSTVTLIDGGAFNGCTGLTKFTIGKNVATLGTNALAGCTAMQEIIVDADNANYSSYDGCLYTKDFATLKQIALAKTTVTVKEGCTLFDTSCGANAAVEVLNIASTVNKFNGSSLKPTNNLKEVNYPYAGTTAPSLPFTTPFTTGLNPKPVLNIPAGKAGLFTKAAWKNAFDIKEVSTDGISNAAVKAAAVKDIYTISGVSANKNAKGAVIMRMTDGSVVKTILR